MRPLVRRAVIVFVGGLLAAVPGGAPAGAHGRPVHSWTVTGPDGGPTATIGYDPVAGTVSLAVARAGQPVLEPGPVGIVTERVDLSAGLRPLGRSDRWVFERYTTLVGKRTHRAASGADVS